MFTYVLTTNKCNQNIFKSNRVNLGVISRPESVVVLGGFNWFVMCFNDSSNDCFCKWSLVDLADSNTAAV